MTSLRPSRPAEQPRLRRLWKENFGDSEVFIDLFFRSAYAPERSLVLIHQEELVGAGYWLDCSVAGKRLAYLYAITIDSRYQRQGLGTQLLKAMHDRLARQGYAGALLVPGSRELRGFYARLGYRTCAHRPMPHGPIPDSPVSPGQYARLRRALLPTNGVIQEGENLRFLAGQAAFYADGSRIAAVSTQDGRCLELLGPEQVNTAEDYAMLLPLGQEQLPEELYFAFGFD